MNILVNNEKMYLINNCNNNNICIPNNAIRIINKINNNYSKAIADAGGIPVILPLVLVF